MHTHVIRLFNSWSWRTFINVNFSRSRCARLNCSDSTINILSLTFLYLLLRFFLNFLIKTILAIHCNLTKNLKRKKKKNIKHKIFWRRIIRWSIRLPTMILLLYCVDRLFYVKINSDHWNIILCNWTFRQIL